MLFAITDIETTGSHAEGNSIIEIGVCLFDGIKVIREFQTLIDPGVRLPIFITSLTGINDYMLKSAPTFDKIADELEEILGDAIFVAHNVHFDYSFIKAEFAAIGRQWSAPRLCTMRFARKAFPDITTYGLGNLCKWLGINNETAHRALSDARAAKDLFEKSLSVLGNEELQKMIAKSSGEVFLPPNLDKHEFDNLPEKPGVYFFYNDKGKPIYIGKSKNLKKRVRQHFTNSPESKKMQGFMKEIFHISCELTGTELIALLLEDAEIRKHWPAYNNAQKRRPLKVNVVRYLDQSGYERLAIQQNNKIIAAHKSFSSTHNAKNWLMELAKEFDIDMRLLGLDMFDVNREVMPAIEHNEKLNFALLELLRREPSFVIQAEGRIEGECSFVLVRNGIFKGFTFLNEGNISLEDIESNVLYLPPSETNASILSNVSEHYKGYKRLDVGEPIFS